MPRPAADGASRLREAAALPGRGRRGISVAGLRCEDRIRPPEARCRKQSGNKIQQSGKTREKTGGHKSFPEQPRAAFLELPEAFMAGWFRTEV